MQILKALFVANSNLSTNAHLRGSFKYKDGRERYLLYFKITSEIKTSWLYVWSFLCCPKGLKHNLEQECNSCHSVQQCTRWWIRPIRSELQFLFLSIYFHTMQDYCKSGLEAIQLSCTWGRLKQVRCLDTLDVVSVSFLNACSGYVGFGPVFLCTYEESCNRS